MGTLGRVRDWVTTPPTLVGFGAVLAIADPILRLVRLFGERAMSVVAQWAQVMLVQVFRLSGTRISVERSDELEDGEGYLLVPNHQSMVDIALIGGTLRSNFPKFVTKRELAKWIPTVSYNVRAGGHLIIDRAKGRDAITRLREFGHSAQEKHVSPVIFVEGSRSRDGRLREFKQAGFAALLEAAPNLKVVPVAIDGSWQLLKDRFLPVPWGVDLRIRFLDPIERAAREDPAEMLERVKESIQSTLDAWRATPTPA